MDYGICHLGIIPIRKEKGHHSEMVSQIIYGECYKLIEKRKEWAKIRLEWDGYEGWININQVHNITREDFFKISQSKLKISSDLVNFISTKDNFLFPVLIGSDLRALKMLNHKFEGESILPQKSKKKIDRNSLFFPKCSLFMGWKNITWDGLLRFYSNGI